MPRKTVINKSLANDCCHYVGFCKDGVIKDKSVYGFSHSITIELDPVPGYRYGVCAPLTVYIPHGHKEMWKGRNLAGCTISILAYTKPVNTPSGRKYPLPVAVSIDAISKGRKSALMGKSKRSDCVLVREG